MSANKLPVIFLMGPTAAGKTDVAVKLAHQIPCTLISVDSALVYRGMDIGTAKPDKATLAGAPHQLVDILEPSTPYDVNTFVHDALREIAQAHAQGRIPVLVGGTMLYFHALKNGLASLPAASSVVRAKLAAQAARYGWQVLHQRLAQIDSIAAMRIHPNDAQRIGRALEVYYSSGQSLTTWLQRQVSQPFPYRAIQLIIAPASRACLHQRIETRFKQMLARGLVDEVSALKERGDLTADTPSMRTVGYRQVWAYLAGEQTYESMTCKGIYASRQFAKRQLTWLRRLKGDTIWYDSLDTRLASQVLLQVQTCGTMSDK